MHRGSSDKRIDKAVAFTLLGLFFLPSFIRHAAIPEFASINYLAVVGVSYIVTKTISKRKIKMFDFINIVFIVILAAIFLFSEIHAGRSLKGIIRVFCGLILPLFMLFYRMERPENTLRVIVRLFNCVSLFILVVGIANIISQGSIMYRYYLLCGDYNYASMAAPAKRLYSYVGHPLYNAEIFLSTLGLTYCYNEIFLHNHKPDKWTIIICVLGTALTASKSAIAIILTMLIILYIKNIKYMMFCLIILVIGYQFHVFDAVILRFAGSLTTGRAEVWDRISDSGIDFFHFFWGNGADSKYAYSYLEEWARAAFEYPAKLYALEFGILFSAIMMYFLFIRPLIYICRNKGNWKILAIVFVGISAHVNIYNGIGTYSDHLYFFCLFACAILNMSLITADKR